jgi:glutaredoxin 3
MAAATIAQERVYAPFMEPGHRPSPPQPPELPQLHVRYCGIHGLVIGPEGRCVICKRNMAEPVKEGSGRGVVAAVLVLAAVLGGALMYKGLAGKPPPPSPPPPVVASKVPVAPRAGQGSSPFEGPEDDPAKSEAATERAVEKQHDLEDAAHRVRVTVYTTAACDLCRTATAYLKEQGLSYTELDVDKDEAALEALKKLRPDPAVPTFEVDGEVVVGFGPREMGAAIARAAQRRVR